MAVLFDGVMAIFRLVRIVAATSVRSPKRYSARVVESECLAARSRVGRAEAHRKRS